MTELLPTPKPPSGSGADQSAHIRTLEVQLASDPNNPSLHTRLARAYVDAGLFDEAIKKFERCYKLNIQNTKGSEPQKRINSTVKAATTAGTIGQHFLNHSQNTLNTSPEQAEEYWRKGMEWKKQEYRLITTLINSDPSKKHDLAMIAGKIGQEYLNASHGLREANPKQAKQYWLRGMKWKEKSWRFDEKLSWTDPRTIKRTLENCAKTAAYISKEYLKASTRLWEGERPKQAEQYWLEGMAWKEKAYGSYKELSDTDSSKEQDCALTAAQLGEKFANQGMDYYAVKWYEKALHHDPDNESIDRACKGLRMKMALEELIHEGGRSS